MLDHKLSNPGFGADQDVLIMISTHIITTFDVTKVAPYMIWKHNPSLDIINGMMKNTLVDHLDIKVVEIGEDFIKATMPVQAKSKQPMGLLHGGASAALSESIGSIAGVLIIEDITKEQIVGVELNANHLKSAKSGTVYSITKAIKIGRRIQVWNTEIFDESHQLLCTSRLTTMRISVDG